uniref:Lipoprotein n=1 Tax=Mycolicibacterium gilvum (strain PYR-GCK) TaxID=350054 RepID=A4TAF3_MYCGI|nr:conserved hypothetical protein [Mycolicibacterium gilvum PYR-GCK]
MVQWAMRSPIRAGLVAAALLSTGCSGPTVVTTEDAAQTTATSAAPTPTTGRPSNVHLANAFDFAADTGGQTGYYFSSPSGRWACAILPRVRAGCQNAQSTSSIGIDGAPDEISGPGGESLAPNAITIERSGGPRFVRMTPPGFALTPGPAAELPFNRILAVGGFRCNVQQASGISCLSEAGGGGFTFSAEGFTTAYTDVPPGAP